MKIQWNENKSIALSRALLLIFLIALGGLDLVCIWLWGGAAALPRSKVICFCLCVWLCTIPGLALLSGMNRLLKNLRDGGVFVPENVHLMRAVSDCCFAAAAICAGFGFSVITLWVFAAAAGFVGLIVRIVKNTFEQAIAMKDELDYTV